MDDFKQQFEAELKKAKENTVLSQEYKRKKIIIYIIRTTISVVLFYMFWEYNWVRWFLVLYIPLNLFSLASIFGWTYFLNRKISQTREKIDELDEFEEDSEEE